MCPSTLLEEDDGDAVETVRWWLASSTFGALGGGPVGPPEWPRPGGEFHQDAKVTEAVDLLRQEWAFLPINQKKPDKKTAAGVPATAPEA